jgi:hypothetical protein
MLSILFAVVFLVVPAVNAGQTISLKGFAYSVEKPDIAFVIIKTSGEGKDYSLSDIDADNNIADIVSLAKKILHTEISPTTIKTERKAKPTFDPENYEDYSQEYFQQMAQAIKGEVPKAVSEKKEDSYITTKYALGETL